MEVLKIYIPPRLDKNKKIDKSQALKLKIYIPPRLDKNNNFF